MRATSAELHPYDQLTLIERVQTILASLPLRALYSSTACIHTVMAHLILVASRHPFMGAH